jgi:hypothetical protein
MELARPRQGPYFSAYRRFKVRPVDHGFESSRASRNERVRSGSQSCIELSRRGAAQTADVDHTGVRDFPSSAVSERSVKEHSAGNSCHGPCSLQ